MARGDAGRQGTSRGAEDASRHVRAFDGRLLRLAVPEHRALVAHRPSTIVLADRTVVIEQGRVAETGTYASLFAAGGALTRLLARSPRRDLVTFSWVRPTAR